ncbi:MAG: hypothetical protein OEZ59_01715 [Deltaproteobacteria bacterium]|nr:hypothetical protein [Deltaproteobacteria bacterium]
MTGKKTKSQEEVFGDNVTRLPLSDVPGRLELHLEIDDQELIQELIRHEEGSPRERFALTALRLGILALRQATGQLDAGTLRNEGQRLIGEVETTLLRHSDQTQERVSAFLKQYFDPSDGNLTMRLEKLVRHDGEIATLLRQHMAMEDSTLARTLARHMGQESPLFKLLSPNQSDGLLASLSKLVEQQLRDQREQVLRQFSLDDGESALSRLLHQISTKNGTLRDELSKDVEQVRREFSLDNEDGALSRLVRRVEDAQTRITAELSLDEENSALSRIHRELMGFQAEIKAALETITMKKDTERRSTLHGLTYEDAFAAFLSTEAQRSGDLFQHTGATTGAVPRSKKGDFVITLGPDAAADGARIVLEAKNRQGTTIQAALAELDEAKLNRQAAVGVFVLGTHSQTEGMDPLLRYGNDILVCWDSDNRDTDVFLKAAVSLARAMVTREHKAGQGTAAGLGELDAAIAAVIKALGGLSRIKGWAKTITDRARDIDEEADKLERRAAREMENMREAMDSLKEAGSS